jgi:hypothetical protein
MTPPLSPLTQQLIEIMFNPTDAVEASHWLEQECGNNLPFCRDYDEHKMERIRFAALKLSQGQIPTLLKAIDLARRDWRDLLMAADFGNHLDAHETWAQAVLQRAAGM